MEDKKFVPFVPSGTQMKEFTLRALLIGLVLSVILGAANAYLGLKAGMTIAATYPAAVIGMAILKFFKGTILEENLARTVGSIGESVAAGAIFTLPAFYITGIWGGESFSSMESYLTASLILLAGSFLGVLFVALLRRVMVEDKELPFPESLAAAEIHKTGRSSGGGSKFLFGGMIAGALIKIAGELQLFATGWITFLKTGAVSIAGGINNQAGFVLGGPSISPAYLGVGYIIGPRLSALNFAGSVLAWGLMVPMFLVMAGPGFVQNIAGPGVDINSVSTESTEAWLSAATVIWKQVVRIVAIGGMLVAACFTLYKMRDSLFTGLKRSVNDVKKAASGSNTEMERTDKDLKSSWILIGICAAGVISFLITLLVFKTGFLIALAAAIIIIVLAFFFSAVSGYLVGIIGSSNNPISGLTLTALVVTALILVALGVDSTHHGGVAAVLGVAAIVCVAAAVAGEMFQDLKAGHILGGTPWKMQVGDLIGAGICAFVMFGVLIVLNQGDINLGLAKGYEGGFGSKELSAPQAGLMAALSQGIVGGEMSWALIIAGMVMGLAFILMQVKSPMLIFVGMYLPFETVFAIFVGGLIKGILDMAAKRKKYSETQQAGVENTSVLLASGLIAGEALMGLLIAIFAIFNIFFKDTLGIEYPCYIIGLAVLVAVAYFMIRIPLQKANKAK